MTYLRNALVSAGWSKRQTIAPTRARRVVATGAGRAELPAATGNLLRHAETP